MVPRAVLMKTGLKPFNTARTVNTAHPKSTVFSAKPMSHFSKLAQSTARRPYQSKIVLTNKKVTQTNNTAKAKAINTARPKAVNTTRPHSAVVNAVRVNQANIQVSGCSRHMTGNIAYLSDFKKFDRGYVTFGGGAHGGRISGKGTLKTDSLDFEDVYFVNELNFNLFSVSQMCDKKNYVLFTDTECLVLSPNFKLPDENQILLKIPRKDNMYSFDMKNIVPKESLTCLVAKATLDKSMLWHRRLGKQHGASCKSKVLNLIMKPLFMLHLDMFGLTFVSSLMHKKYCLVVTDDYSRFTWVFFLASKDETSEILKNFIKEIENLVDKKLGTPRQNGMAEKRNRTLIEAARTMLADSKLPTTFWAKAVSTACYVENRVLVVKPHNKTPYELFRGTITNESVGIQGELNADSPKDMFKMGASHTLKATYVEFFSDKDELEVDLGNILNSYTIEPTSISKALSDSSWVEAIQEELLQFKLQQVWILMDLPIDVKTTSTSVDLERPLVKDGDADDVDIDVDKYSRFKIKCWIMDLLTKGFDAGSVTFERIDYGENEDYSDDKKYRRKENISIACLYGDSRWRCMILFQTDSSYIVRVIVLPMKCYTLGLKGAPQSSGPPVKVGDKAVHKELGDRMERAGTTSSSLEAEQATAKANTVNSKRQLQALVDKKRVIITESSIRSDLHLEDGGGIDCLSTATIFEELARMRKETEVPQDETHHDDSVPIPSNDPLLSGEDRMQLTELMILCTNLQKQVLDLEKAKDAQAKEIVDLKKRV
ncbi:putative ribonuclease H-like domain-containing protein [Tanacetum coccineum]|uniref:Ribonuclease H-like domain-containing protein n=1 Tax=Tanacetum coccineum TaxID=301880 RepID=A0ABQ4WSL7_9ASTR